MIVARAARDRARRRRSRSPARGWSSLVAIAVFCTVVAILAFFAGLRLLGPTSTSVLSTLEPVVTVALATWLLGESLSGVQALGALVLGAVVWLAVSQRPAEVQVPPAPELVGVRSQAEPRNPASVG